MKMENVVKFNDIVIYETKNFVGAVPTKPHVPRLDGGHIWIRAKEKYFESRADFEPKVAIEIMRMTMILGEAMITGMKNRGIEIERINYQENGNWAYQDGRIPTFHIHLYGRTRNAKTQVFGEALVFPNKSTGFYDDFESFDKEDITEIQKQIRALEKTDKYDIANWKI